MTPEEMRRARAILKDILRQWADDPDDEAIGEDLGRLAACLGLPLTAVLGAMVPGGDQS